MILFRQDVPVLSKDYKSKLLDSIDGNRQILKKKLTGSPLGPSNPIGPYKNKWIYSEIAKMKILLLLMTTDCIYVITHAMT